MKLGNTYGLLSIVFHGIYKLFFFLLPPACGY